MVQSLTQNGPESGFCMILVNITRDHCPSDHLTTTECSLVKGGPSLCRADKMNQLFQCWWSCASSSAITTVTSCTLRLPTMTLSSDVQGLSRRSLLSEEKWRTSPNLRHCSVKQDVAGACRL